MSGKKRKREGFDEFLKKEIMTQERYDQMVSQVASFGKLLREGYFTKKVLIDAMFKLMYD